MHCHIEKVFHLYASQDDSNVNLLGVSHAGLDIRTSQEVRSHDTLTGGGKGCSWMFQREAERHRRTRNSNRTRVRRAMQGAILVAGRQQIGTPVAGPRSTVASASGQGMACGNKRAEGTLRSASERLLNRLCVDKAYVRVSASQRLDCRFSAMLYCPTTWFSEPVR